MLRTKMNVELSLGNGNILPMRVAFAILVVAVSMTCCAANAQTGDPSAPSTDRSSARKAGQAAKAKKPTKGRRATRGKAPAHDVAPAAPSFTTNIAPILLARCGGCHIQDTRGGLSMANFAALARGARAGPIIAPGDSRSSRLVDVIFSGKMPRGGGQVAPEELAAIAAWIDAGARFDGIDPTAPLGQQPPGDNRPRDVQFLRDLAPAIVASCLKCHSSEEPAGKLSLETVESIARGGQSGRVIIPGKARDSLLIKRLRGAGVAQMPKDKPALQPDNIAKFETWIDKGAELGGLDPQLPLADAVENLAARAMSHEELAAKRAVSAAKMWELAAVGDSATKLQTANFLLLGNLPQSRLKEISKLAETERAKIAKQLKLDGGAPFVKGRLAVFVLRDTTAYAQFLTHVEERDLPEGSAGHARARGADLYAVLVVPADDDDDNLPALVAERVAAAFLLSLGNVPSWFAAGGGRAIAARVEPQNRIVKQWDADSLSAAPAASVDAFLSADPYEADSVACSYSFMRPLLQKLPQFQALVASLGQDQDFDEALSGSFRHDSGELVELWLRRKPSRGKN